VQGNFAFLTLPRCSSTFFYSFGKPYKVLTVLILMLSGQRVLENEPNASRAVSLAYLRRIIVPVLCTSVFAYSPMVFGYVLHKSREWLGAARACLRFRPKNARKSWDKGLTSNNVGLFAIFIRHDTLQIFLHCTAKRLRMRNVVFRATW
jgi:hypothetical protein